MKLLGTKQKHKLQKKAKPSPSTEMSGENSALPQVPVIPSLNTCHLTASTLPLAKFIDVLCDNNLQALIISGNPSQIELLDAWEGILSEYTMIIGNSQSQYLLALQRSILIIQCKITIVDASLKVLEHKRSDIAVMELGKIGYRFSFNWNDQVSYQRDLKAVHTRSKSLLDDLKIKQQQLDRVSRNETTQHKTSEDFDAEIGTLSRYQGYRIDRNVTTVSEYAHIYKDFVKHLDQQTSKANA